MMRGCGKFVLAVVAGLALGGGGLAVALWLWAGANIFSPQPSITAPEWGALREAGLSLKLAPAYLAIKRGKEDDFAISLRPEELNHVLDQRVPELFPRTDLAVEPGDTATIIKFSRQIEPHKFVNGEIRAQVSGRDGQFEVKVTAVKAGRKKLPHSLFYPVGRWMENSLETQLPFKNERYKLTGFRQDGDNMVVEIRTRPDNK